MQSRYLWKKPRRGRGNARKETQQIISRVEKGLTGFTHAQRELAGWAGTEDDSQELCFPRKCRPSSRVRAESVSLPHLSSPLPIPLRALVPGWCFLVAAAAVSMCVTDPQPPAAGVPLPALRLSRRALELSRVLSSASAPPCLSLLVAGYSPWRLSRVLPHAVRLTGWGVRFSLLGQGWGRHSENAEHPWPRWGWRFYLIPFILLQFPCLFREAGQSVKRGGPASLCEAGLRGPDSPTPASAVRSNSYNCGTREI